MTALNVNINGREYRVACDDGQEAHLKRVAGELDGRIRELSKVMGPTTPDTLLLVIASLMLTDELQDTSRELQRLRDESTHTSQSFERSKKIEMDNTLSETIHDIAERIERINTQLA